MRAFDNVTRTPRASDLDLDKVKRSHLTLTLTSSSGAPQGAPRHTDTHMLASMTN